MMVIRPITNADLPALVGLASSTGVGLTTLPPNREELTKRVDAAVASFAGTAAKEDEIFLFVLEDTATQQVTGTCGLATAVGLRQPWYSYRVGLVVHASQELGLFTQTPTLFLTNDHTGHTELCSLFLDAAYRRDRNGQLLSKSRLLFLAQHRQRFSKKIIAELRGVSDANGKSPFWESLGRHFFSMEFSRADYLTGIGKKSFVAELMPKHPLYSSFLTLEAQDVIGKTHPETLPALHMLEREGFRYEGYVDIFDAGPTVECDVDDVSAVEYSRIFTVRVTDSAPPTGALSFLVSNTGIANYRATIVPACPDSGGFMVNAETAAALGVDSGDPVRAVPLSVSDRHERQT